MTLRRLVLLLHQKGEVDSGYCLREDLSTANSALGVVDYIDQSVSARAGAFNIQNLILSTAGFMKELLSVVDLVSICK